MSVKCALVVLVACSPPPTRPSAPDVRPPIAERRAYEVKAEHGTRSDPYYWLRDDTKQDKRVIAYLEAENAYARAMLAPLQDLEDELAREARARVDETETSVPEREGAYWYYYRYERGEQHPIHARKKALDGPEEILFDGDAMAKGHAYFAIGDYAVSPDGMLIAWTEDTVGRNQYTLRVKELASGKLLDDTATNIASSVVWANDNQTVFYVGRDATTLREDRVLRRAIGGAEEVVYEEKDDSYYVNVGITKSRRFITIELDATTESETRLVDADKPTGAARVFWPREEEHLYDVEHLAGRFVVRSNKGAENFQLVDDRRNVIVAERADAFIEDFAVYANAIALEVRTGGHRRVRVVPAKGAAFDVEARDPTFVMSLADTTDPDATRVRYEYDSLVSPSATYEVDVAGKSTLLKQDRVPGYDATKYTSEYVHVTASDGVRVPVSIVKRRDTPRGAPLLLLGYGAYGEAFEPVFDRERTSLLDRGWVVAIAHVRGGGELGRSWYDAGRVLAKKTTFSDFIAVTEYLVAQKYAGRVFCEGSSAGGLLVATVATMRPELYRGVIAWVPFVDVVTTMLDETLPLVTNEYEEWGDPREKAAYDYMLSYSPYDNVRAQPYPALYVRTGFHDGLVSYHEPAKWVAKLRATKTGDRPLLFETDFKAGHGGVSGRYDAIREEARAYAFLLAQAR